MNESFSDLSVIGDINTDNYLPYFHSLKEDSGTLEYGYDYVSVRGGGTVNTEYEALTGFSVENEKGATPFVQYNFDSISSIPKLLQEQGYETMAVHPYFRTSYHRNKVYPEMGFDEYISRESFGEDPVELRKEYYSDQGDYEKIIELYEQKGSTPIYIHNVTIQNHGGYDGMASLNDPSSAIALDAQYPYDDLCEYETMMKASDDALKYLISYFKSVNEPVILCFFGDHQPVLNDTFTQSLLKTSKSTSDLAKNQSLYAAPYFIWSNYDTGMARTSNSFLINGLNVISPNYMYSTVLDYAGLAQSPYTNYLQSLRKEIPALNRQGYMDTSGIWHDDFSSNSLLKAYSYVQYSGMHDEKRSEQNFTISGM